MSEIDTGGYVYPQIKGRQITAYESEAGTAGGITRRDWLIGNIIKGLVSNPNILTGVLMQEIAEGTRGGKSIVVCAERLADLEIAEGRKGGE